MYQHLKERAYYDNLYDQFTIEKCLRHEDICKIQMEKCNDAKERAATDLVRELLLWSMRGERYRNKRERIEKWMDRDRKRDELLENANIPSNILCRDCGVYMKLESKDLRTEQDASEEKVLFIMRCEECRKGKAVFSDGSEWKPSPQLCPDCRGELQSKHGRVKDRLTTEYTCSNCSYGECSWLDLKDDERDEKEIRLFRINREKYCLSDKEGQEYIAQTARIQFVCDEMGDKETWSAKKQARELQKLNIKALEKEISKTAKKAGYEKLRFKEPEIAKDIIVEFKIQDAKEDRESYDSKQTLKKAIDKALKNTNWRLMSQGVDYRLGVLSGRLRGYENEEDLVKLVKSKK